MMLRIFKPIALAALAMLLLAGCGEERPVETTASAAASTGGTATLTATVTTAETAATETTTTTAEPPSPTPLPAGMLVYSQDFDDFPDTEPSGIPTALRWSRKNESSGARFAIRAHRLYFTNLSTDGKRHDDAVYLLGTALPEQLAEYPFTLQYDIEYLGGEAGAHTGMIAPKEAAGLPSAEAHGTARTVRLCWEPQVGFTVWQKGVGERDFVKTGDPLAAAKGEVCFYVGDAEGYLDNIRLWIGHGDAPDANVLCYWQWLIQNPPQTEGGSA